MPMIPSRFTIIQIGARRRYAVPRIFFQAGLLERFYTDILITQGWPRLFAAIPKCLQPRWLRRLTSRGEEMVGLVDKRVKTFPLLGIKYAVARIRARSADATTRVHFDVADELSREVLRGGLGDATHLYGFDTASLVAMRAVTGSGIHIVMEQTNATRPVWKGLLQREREKHPGWEDSSAEGTMDEVIQARYWEAWALADTIICGSEFVREGIRCCGGPVSKCTVVPYGVDFDRPDGAGTTWRCSITEERYARQRAGEPLHVLTVGAVGLNKGAPYVLEAAKAFRGRAHFRMVGPMHISQKAVEHLARTVELTGLVPRNEVQAHYLWADVFLFPSVCEGSAAVVYEALAHGLPVVCTPNTGSVVKDGVDGLIVEASSGEAVIAALEKLIADPQLCRTMGQNAFATSDQMDVKHYGERLLRATGCGEVRSTARPSPATGHRVNSAETDTWGQR
jgi:glycosyltransferase involved in cell wall biosynthesis